MLVQIFFIYADNCVDCEAAQRVVEGAIKESKVQCEVKMFNSDTRVALNIALQNDVEDVPACIIGKGGAVFQGTNFNKKEVIAAIKKSA